MFDVEKIKALGNPTRLFILQQLAAHAEDSICVQDLQQLILKEREIEQPTVSYHLKILAQAKLVSPTRSGIHMYYHVNRRTYQEILSFLTLLVAERKEPCPR